MFRGMSKNFYFTRLPCFTQLSFKEVNLAGIKNCLTLKVKSLKLTSKQNIWH